MTDTIYSSAAPDYLAAGWSPLPIKQGAKRPAVSGYHGLAGPMATSEDVERFSAAHGAHNIALRLPDGVVGIDVDNYGHKQGAEQLAALVDELGSLPSSPLSTSRDTSSGIRFYRAPAELRTVGKLGPDVDVISHGIRYAVVAPSVHPEGRPYRWVDPDTGEDVPAPSVRDLPELPAPWVSRITSTRSGTADTDARLAEADDGPMDDVVREALDEYRAKVETGQAERRDALDVTRLLARAMAEGRSGVPTAYAEAAALHESVRPGKADDLDKMLGDALAYFDENPPVRMPKDFDPGELAVDAEEAPARRSKWDNFLIDSGDLDNLPAPEPLIADTLDRDTLAILSGGYGTGKSFVAIAWALSVATGTPWMGRKVEKGRVLFVLGEGLHGMRSRRAAWMKHHGVDVANGALTFTSGPVNLGDGEDVDALSEIVRRGGYSLVVFDTLARMTVGMEENSAKDMGVVVDAADRIRRASPGSTVVMVAHTGKNAESGIRGSSALPGAADTVYEVARDGQTVKLKRVKRKDGPEEDRLTFTMVEVDSSLVLVPEDGSESKTDARDREIAESIRELLVRLGPSSTSVIVKHTTGNDKRITEVLGDLARQHFVTVEDGPRNSKIWTACEEWLTLTATRDAEIVALREGLKAS